jgi:predicted CopG family antitoxin
MKSIEEVLRSKEEEIQRVRKEVEALRIAAGLLSDQDAEDHKPEYRQLLQMP